MADPHILKWCGHCNRTLRSLDLVCDNCGQEPVLREIRARTPSLGPQSRPFFRGRSASQTNSRRPIFSQNLQGGQRHPQTRGRREDHEEYHVLNYDEDPDDCDYELSRPVKRMKAIRTTNEAHYQTPRGPSQAPLRSKRTYSSIIGDCRRQNTQPRDASQAPQQHQHAVAKDHMLRAEIENIRKRISEIEKEQATEVKSETVSDVQTNPSQHAPKQGKSIYPSIRPAGASIFTSNTATPTERKVITTTDEGSVVSLPGNYGFTGLEAAYESWCLVHSHVSKSHGCDVAKDTIIRAINRPTIVHAMIMPDVTPLKHDGRPIFVYEAVFELKQFLSNVYRYVTFVPDRDSLQDGCLVYICTRFEGQHWVQFFKANWLEYCVKMNLLTHEYVMNLQRLTAHCYKMICNELFYEMKNKGLVGMTNINSASNQAVVAGLYSELCVLRQHAGEEEHLKITEGQLWVEFIKHIRQITDTYTKRVSNCVKKARVLTLFLTEHVQNTPLQSAAHFLIYGGFKSIIGESSLPTLEFEDAAKLHSSVRALIDTERVVNNWQVQQAQITQQTFDLSRQLLQLMQQQPQQVQQPQQEETIRVSANDGSAPQSNLPPQESTLSTDKPAETSLSQGPAPNADSPAGVTSQESVPSADKPAGAKPSTQ